MDISRYNRTYCVVVISGQFTITSFLDRNVIKPTRKRRNLSKLVMQASMAKIYHISPLEHMMDYYMPL